MSDYLMHYNKSFTIENKRRIFSIRNRMISIPAYYLSSKIEYKCVGCEEKEDMIPVYSCKLLNMEEPPQT